MQKFVLNTAAWFARSLPTSWKQAIYHTGPLARFLRSILNRAAPGGLSRVRVAGGDLKGSRLYLNLQTEKDYWLGTYEMDLQKAVRDWVKPGMTAYDIGANIGYISLLLAKAVGPQGRVFSFEALPSNVERLKQNIFPSPASKAISVIHAAVGSRSEPQEFLVHHSTSMGKLTGSAGRTETTYESVITVPGTALDDYLHQHNLPKPDVIKMDIEGGEVLAIEGMREILRLFHPLLFIELHGPESARKVGKVLSEFHYQVFRMSHPGKIINLEHPEHWKAYIIAR